jgi:hypothetical protein
VVVPVEAPDETKPVVDPMVAIPVLVLSHVPPLGTADNEVVDDTQVDNEPEITGKALTVTVTFTVPHVEA